MTVLLTTIEDLVRDFRLALRSLARTPGFTAVAVVALALGIGVVSGAFTLLNVLVLKPVVIEKPEDVLNIYTVHSEKRNGRLFSYPEYVALREEVRSFSNVAAHEVVDVGIEEGNITRRVQASLVSANYFETLGVPLARGRGFTLGEERGEEPATAVVSYDYWMRNGEDPNLLGSLVRVNGEPLTVVGIAARGFTGTLAILGVDAWMPLAMERSSGIAGSQAPDLRDPERRSLFLFGRQADGVSTTEAEAEAELAALAARNEMNIPDPDGGRYTYVAGDMMRFAWTTAPSADGEGLLDSFLLPLAMSVVVLAVACLNLANMFLARGASRRTEMAIRASLGGGRARLVRQLLAEGAVVATLGGAVGLVWTYWATTWLAGSLARVVPQGLTIVVDSRPDVRVLLATVVTAVIAVLLFGFGPAWRVTGKDLLGGLKEGAGAVTLGRGRKRKVSGRNLMIVAQIALSLVMLIAGGLFVRSALLAANAMPSFDLDSTLIVELDPSLAGNDETRSRSLYVEVIERLRTLPGVESVGLASTAPFSGITRDISGIRAAGMAAGEGDAYATRTVVSNGYFDSLGLLLRGRDFTPAEMESAAGPRVAIIDEPLALRLFAGADPLGRQIEFPARGPDGESIVMEIVGVAPGTPGPGYEPASSAHVYLPFGRIYMPGMYMLIRVNVGISDAASLLEPIRAEIREIDSSLPVLRMATMREFRDVNINLWFTRFGGQLLALLGVLALFLAMVGLYGIKAFLMARRTHEIGVRMALGATREGLLRQMMRENLVSTVAGLVVGLAVALAVGQVLESLLYEVSATDPWVFVAATAFLACTAALATWLPVERAIRVEPGAALRNE